MHELNVPKASLRGDHFSPSRMGSLHPDGGPTGVFRYKGEEFIAIMVIPHQWEQMTRAMKMPELARDPRFNTPRARRDNNRELKTIIENWLATFASRDRALAALEAERVPCAPVLTLQEAMAHPHLRRRGTVRRVKDSALGEFDIPGLAAKFSEWPERTSLQADLLGEHNEQVLKELLDLSDSEIAELYADKVLVRDTRFDSEAKNLKDSKNDNGHTGEP
jgi:CoA:oxalate CoA-transferase